MSNPKITASPKRTRNVSAPKKSVDTTELTRLHEQLKEMSGTFNFSLFHSVGFGAA